MGHRAHRKTSRARKKWRAKVHGREDPTAIPTNSSSSSSSSSAIAVPRGVAEFTRYYFSQNIVQSKNEFKLFIASLRRPLPVTFRLNRGLHADGVVDRCVEALRRIETRGGVAEPLAFPVTWCDAFQLNVDRQAMKGEAGDDQRRRGLQQWLAQFGTLPSKQGSLGVITRQELASMVPVSLLGIESHHAVLDMCASPGSKTLQVVCALRQSARAKKGGGGGATPTGFVVANDLDSERAYHLANRCRLISCPTPELVVVNHRAQRLPNPIVDAGKGRRRAPYPDGIFDRIVCDVPCSGDGALRKIPEAWRHWNPGQGTNIHMLQLQIALRGVALLKVGGIIAYSTCTFNPIEDEAVVCELLRRCGGSLELVDTRSMLPTLDRMPGIKKWTVWGEKDRNRAAPGEEVEEVGGSSLKDSDMIQYHSFDSVPKSHRKHLRPSMWTPSPDAFHDGQLPPLHYTMRLLPHLQDTGGFYVALLRKVAPLKGPVDSDDKKTTKTAKRSKKEEESSSDDSSSEEEESDDDEDHKKKKKRKVPVSSSLPQQYVPSIEDSWNYLPVPKDVIGATLEHFGIKRDEEMMSMLWTRSTASHTVSLMSPSVVKNCLASPGASRLHIVRTGVRVFEAKETRNRHLHARKQEEEEAPLYWLSQEGLASILPYITKQKITIRMQDFPELLSETFRCKPIELSQLTSTAQASFTDKKNKISGPCVVFVLDDQQAIDLKIDAGSVAFVGEFLKNEGEEDPKKWKVRACVSAPVARFIMFAIGLGDL